MEGTQGGVVDDDDDRYRQRRLEQGQYLRIDVFRSEHRRLEDRLSYLEKREEAHEREHDEEAQWRRRMMWTAFLAPLGVAVIGALIVAMLITRGP